MAMIKNIMDQNKYSNLFLDNMDSLKDQDPTASVPSTKKSPPLEGENSTKMVACVLSNMMLSHQNSMNSSLR